MLAANLSWPKAKTKIQFEDFFLIFKVSFKNANKAKINQIKVSWSEIALTNETTVGSLHHTVVLRVEYLYF